LVQRNVPPLRRIRVSQCGFDGGEEMTTEKHTPGQRVRDYLAARATMTGNSTDTVHTGGTVGGEYPLRVDDLAALSTPLRDAAPDMLAALEEIIRIDRLHGVTRESNGRQVWHDGDCAKIARAAIAKATGATP
jgi:hypothetical protein